MKAVWMSLLFLHCNWSELEPWILHFHHITHISHTSQLYCYPYTHTDSYHGYGSNQLPRDSDLLLHGCCIASLWVEMHSGTAPVLQGCDSAAVFAERAGPRQPAAPAITSSSTSSLFQAGQQTRATLQPVHGAALHTGGEWGGPGQRGAAAPGQRLCWKAEDGEHKLFLLWYRCDSVHKIHFIFIFI